MLFSPYGPILSIIALKTPQMRGQAHIVFDSIPHATAALHALQGFTFHSKPLKIVYSRSKSNIVAIQDGTFRMPVPNRNSTPSVPALAARHNGDAEVNGGSNERKRGREEQEREIKKEADNNDSQQQVKDEESSND